MKTNKKYIIVLISVISIIMMYAPISLGIVAKDVAPSTQIVSKGVAILLSCMQVLQYVVPGIFLIAKLIINKKKENGKNTFKNICLYIFICILLFWGIFGLGSLILKNTSTYGYSSKTIDYINYNGKVIYFHR